MLLNKIQEQTSNLEVEVAKRTVELTEANKQLRIEIKERRQAERASKIYATELERSNQELDNFANIASHDLQEPLCKITAFGNRLQQKYADVLDERGLDYLLRMQSAAQRMQGLIMDLLVLSRITTQSQPFLHVALDTVTGWGQNHPPFARANRDSNRQQRPLTAFEKHHNQPLQADTCPECVPEHLEKKE
jgi:signal transduction histidine kinase